MKTMPLLCALVSATSPLLQAAVIYETGFEPPTYSLGNLNGQDGWSGDGIVQDSMVRSGTQALEMNLDTGGALPLAIHGLSYAATPRVDVQVDLRLEGEFEARSGLILLMNGAFGPQLIANGSGPLVLDQTPTQGTLGTGQWYTLGLSLDFQARTVAAYLDGSWVGSAALTTPGDQLTEVWLAGGVEGTGQRVFFDNLSVTAVPEPRALVPITGLALLGLALMRRKSP